MCVIWSEGVEKKGGKRGEVRKEEKRRTHSLLYSPLPRFFFDLTAHLMDGSRREKAVSIESKPPNCGASSFSFFVSQDIQGFAPPLFFFVSLSTSPFNRPSNRLNHSQAPLNNLQQIHHGSTSKKLSLARNISGQENTLH